MKPLRGNMALLVGLASLVLSTPSFATTANRSTDYIPIYNGEGLTDAGVLAGLATIGVRPGMNPRQISPYSPREYTLRHISAHVSGNHIILDIEVRPVQ